MWQSEPEHWNRLTKYSMPEKKVSLQKCKDLVKDCHIEMTNTDIEEITDCLYSIANLLLEQYLNNYKKNDDRETN